MQKLHARMSFAFVNVCAYCMHVHMISMYAYTHGKHVHCMHAHIVCMHILYACTYCMHVHIVCHIYYKHVHMAYMYM